MDLLSLIDRMGERDAEIHVINITRKAAEGRPENTEATVSGLPNASSVQIHNTTAQTIADGLVDRARETAAVSSSSELPGPAASDAASSGALPTT